MLNGRRIAVVFPAYNAEATLERTWAELPHERIDLCVLVDDASHDRTARIAADLGLRVIRHDGNRGYGGSQKTCYREALDAGADIVVMVHPDYQYDPRVVPHMVGLIDLGICDVVLGNRIRSRREGLDGGMPLYKYLSNRFLTFVENLVTGQNLGEWHSGLRAYSAEALRAVRWEDNSDDFIFDQQVLFQFAAAGFRLGDVPVPARYFPEASSIGFTRALRYGLLTLVYTARFLLHRARILRVPLFEPRVPSGPTASGAPRGSADRGAAG